MLKQQKKIRLIELIQEISLKENRKKPVSEFIAA